MKIYVNFVIDQHIVKRLSENGYDEILRDSKKYDFRRSVQTLMDCDAMLVSGSEDGRLEELKKELALMAGLEVIDVRSFDVADKIIDAVTSLYGVTMEQMRGTSRKWEISKARMMLAVAMYDQKISVKRIRKTLNKDRSICHYYIRRANELMRYDRMLLSEYEDKIKKNS